MATINAIITGVFDLALDPLAGYPWAGLVLVSLVTGGVLLLVFRFTSNQRAIKRTKDRILSHLLEVVLYRDEMRVVLRAQARLLLDNLRYLGYALVPLLFMLIPVGLMLAQLELRYGHRPLREGESAIVAVKLRRGADLDQLRLSAPAGIEVETEPLRIPTVNEVDWRVRAVAAGEHELRLSVGGDELTKQLVVGDHAARVSAMRVGAGWWRQLLHPGEAAAPASGPVESITVSYPGAEFALLRWRMHWVWPWLIISMAFGYALKGPLRVQV